MGASEGGKAAKNLRNRPKKLPQNIEKNLRIAKMPQKHEAFTLLRFCAAEGRVVGGAGIIKASPRAAKGAVRRRARREAVVRRVALAAAGGVAARRDRRVRAGPAMGRGSMAVARCSSCTDAAPGH